MISEENQDFCNAALRIRSGFLLSCARRNHEIGQDFSEKKIQTSAELATKKSYGFYMKNSKYSVEVYVLE